MKVYTAEELIGHAKAYIAADAAIMSKRPDEMPRAAWRMENKIDVPTDFLVRDVAYKTRPLRNLSFSNNGDPYDLWVWTTGERRNVIERINLREPDADKKLARYERA